MEKYKVKPTSRNSADVDDIIIRETDRTRLVFKPKLVNNVNDEEAAILTLKDNLKELNSMTEKQLSSFLNIHDEVGLEALNKILSWALKVGEPKKVLEKLEELDINILEKLNSLLGLSRLKEILEIWDKERNNSNENYWQDILGKYAFVLSQIFSFPVFISNDEAYVGGKSIDNTGGNIVDFLLSNKISNNVALVEIKTPETKLLGSEYRTNIPNISKELTGAVTQILSYSDSLLKEYSTLLNDTKGGFEAFNPRCIVIAGDMEQELESKEHRRSFELFRNNLNNVTILTYDELFKRVELLVDTLENN